MKQKKLDFQYSEIHRSRRGHRLFKKIKEVGHETVMVIYLEVIDLEKGEFKLDYFEFLYLDDFIRETITQKGILKVSFIWDGKSLMLTY